jgi:hypothetical protein
LQNTRSEVISGRVAHVVTSNPSSRHEWFWRRAWNDVSKIRYASTNRPPITTTDGWSIFTLRDTRDIFDCWYYLPAVIMYIEIVSFRVGKSGELHAVYNTHIGWDTHWYT